MIGSKLFYTFIIVLTIMLIIFAIVSIGLLFAGSMFELLIKHNIVNAIIYFILSLIIGTFLVYFTEG